MLPMPGDRRWTRRGQLVCCALFVLTAGSTAFAQPRLFGGRSQPQQRSIKDFKTTKVAKGTSSSSVKKVAIQGLPIRQLSPKHQQRAHQILQNVSMYRRLPTLAFEIEPEVYQFFQKHPDVAVSIWRVLKISKFKMWQTGPQQFEADSNEGSLGVVEVAYKSANSQLVICDGIFKSPLVLRPIKAQALIHLQTTYYRNKQGKPHVSHRIDLFVSFPSQSIETAAKVMSPLSHRITDKNFEEVSLFLMVMSQAMQEKPTWVKQLAGQMDGVLPERRAQLMRLTDSVYQSQDTRAAAQVKPPANWK